MLLTGRDLADKVHGSIGVCFSAGEETMCCGCGRWEWSRWVGVRTCGCASEGVGGVCVRDGVCASWLSGLSWEICLH